MILTITYKYDHYDTISNAIRDLGLQRISSGLKSCHACSTEFDYVEVKCGNIIKIRQLATVLKRVAHIKITI